MFKSVICKYRNKFFCEVEVEGIFFLLEIIRKGKIFKKERERKR